MRKIYGTESRIVHSFEKGATTFVASKNAQSYCSKGYITPSHPPSSPSSPPPPAAALRLPINCRSVTSFCSCIYCILWTKGFKEAKKRLCCRTKICGICQKEFVVFALKEVEIAEIADIQEINEAVFLLVIPRQHYTFFSNFFRVILASCAHWGLEHVIYVLVLHVLRTDPFTVSMKSKT